MSAVRRLVVAAAIATLVALVVFAVAPPSLLYPDRCSNYPTVDGVPTQPGQFCLKYIPALGRYEYPPAGIPADVSRVDLDMPWPGDRRSSAGLFAFGLVFLAAWWLVPLTIRLRRTRH